MGNGEQHVLLKHMALVLLIPGQVWWGMVSREFTEHSGGDTGIHWGAQIRSGALAGLLSNAMGADFSRAAWARVFSWQHWCIISLMLLGSREFDESGFPREHRGASVSHSSCPG